VAGRVVFSLIIDCNSDLDPHLSTQLQMKPFARSQEHVLGETSAECCLFTLLGN